LGFRDCDQAGCSIGIDDMIIPKEKEGDQRRLRRRSRKSRSSIAKGIITSGERYNKIIDIWTHATDQIANVMFKTLETTRARKSSIRFTSWWTPVPAVTSQQVRQLCGVRGLMAKPSGDIIEKPILSNFREGLTVLEYFISTHGARKGLADTALKTADSGYMTRKLVRRGARRDHRVKTIAARPTASGCRPSSRAKTKSSSLKRARRGRSLAKTSSNPTTRRNSCPRERRVRRVEVQGVSTLPASRRSRSVPCSPANPSRA
jgi:DNA-directed RNA polymerase beta' subunit